MTDAPITTILLDLDDTILQDDPATDIALLNTCAMAEKRLGIRAIRLVTAIRRESAALWRTNPQLAWCEDLGTSRSEGLRSRFEGSDPRMESLRRWGPGFRRSSWINALASLGMDNLPLADDLNARFELERAVTNPWCDGAREALDALRARYRLGMITNGLPDVQWEKINRTGIAPLFEAIIVSGEVGYGKPDLRIYQDAMSRLQVAPGECLMVGDNLLKDVLAPQELGIRGVWITMERGLPPGSADPWLSVPSLAELPEALKGG